MYLRQLFENHKVAMGIVLVQEGIKAKQASAKNSRYKDITGAMLDVPITMRGKEAMAEKLVGASLAAATHEINNPIARTGVSALAVYFAAAGALRGHKAHQDNMRIADSMITEALLSAGEGQLPQPDDGSVGQANL